MGERNCESKEEERLVFTSSCSQRCVLNAITTSVLWKIHCSFLEKQQNIYRYMARFRDQKIIVIQEYVYSLYEPPREKTNNLHNVKTKTQISLAVTAKLISAFVFATRIVHFLFYLNPKFQASSLLL